MPFSIIRPKLVLNNKMIKEIPNSFFGFHDRPSINSRGVIISHKNFQMDKRGIGTADIYIDNLYNEKSYFLAHTKCCNYQQGSMATWLNDDEIIYNDFDGAPCTKIINIKGEATNEFPWHFNSVSNDGKLATSICYLRFGNGLDGYGYNVDFPAEQSNDAMNKICSSGCSDFIINDLVTGNELYRISLTEAKKLSFGLNDNGYFYFSHSGFSTESNKVYFLLRSSTELYNSSQLFVYDLTNKKLSTYPTAGMVSHLSWLSNDKIIAYCNTKPSHKDNYYIFDTASFDFETLSQSHALNVDGHPHGLSENVFITDTYPDKLRRQKLYSVELEPLSVRLLCDLYSPYKFKDNVRTDLHPRLSKCKKYISIDSTYNGYRSQLVIKCD